MQYRQAEKIQNYKVSTTFAHSLVNLSVQLSKLLITALHGMQTLSNDENSVCLCDS